MHPDIRHQHQFPQSRPQRTHTPCARTPPLLPHLPRRRPLRRARPQSSVCPRPMLTGSRARARACVAVRVCVRAPCCVQGREPVASTALMAATLIDARARSPSPATPAARAGLSVTAWLAARSGAPPPVPSTSGHPRPFGRGQRPAACGAVDAATAVLPPVMLPGTGGVVAGQRAGDAARAAAGGRDALEPGQSLPASGRSDRGAPSGAGLGVGGLRPGTAVVVLAASSRPGTTAGVAPLTVRSRARWVCALAWSGGKTAGNGPASLALLRPPCCHNVGCPHHTHLPFPSPFPPPPRRPSLSPCTSLPASSLPGRHCVDWPAAAIVVGGAGRSGPSNPLLRHCRRLACPRHPFLCHCHGGFRR
jgi:hypothetical protein